ncbi:MAG: UDP-N-acetylmuramoyl-L-alanyl-D-glutamate--2,6-diaminopimelate ligase [Chromatiales bacterium]|nr:UDP-N-acetylmuramoyl-L-alanyl-D-glutamate--2,6-diaminopimelate ligase [Chromatiales bacterium]
MMVAPTQNDGWRLDTLLTGLPVRGLPPAVRVAGLSANSRALRAGEVFVALAGQAHHGLEFLDPARAAGAVAVLAEPDARWPAAAIVRLATRALPVLAVEALGRHAGALAARFHGAPSRRITVVGVTGTNGKTSVTHYLAQALGPDAAVIGTLGSGRPGALASATHTTPDAVSVQEILSGFIADGLRFAAMEVSSHALAQGRVEAVHMPVAILTNVTRDHLDFHGDLDAYRAAKQKLFTRPGLDAAVLNADDPAAEQYAAALARGVRRLRYSLQPGVSELHAKRVATVAEGLVIELDGAYGTATVELPLYGRFNAANALAAAGGLLALGLRLDDVVQRLARLRPVAGRMQRLGGDRQPLVIVDYAHTPDALENLLTAARAHTQGSLICVFGCGGDRDRGKRPLMGAIAERLADQVTITDDNPRHEDGDAIVAEIVAGLERPAAATVQRDRRRAIAAAIGAAAAGDVIVIAGKGHEREQQIGDLRLPFDDAAVARAALDGRE